MTYFYAKVLERKNELITKQLNYHSDSGLPNRIKLDKDLKTTCFKTSTIIDLDHFNEINDLYGYELGDLVLIEVSKRLEQFFLDKKQFKLYKLEHDVFVILNKEPISSNEIIPIMEQVILLIEEVIILDNIEIFLTASMGIYIGSKNYLKNMNLALKHAKYIHENIVIFDEIMNKDEKYKENIHVLRTLRNAISDNTIKPHYQPIVSLDDNTVSKYECLTRLYTDDKILLPNVFINLSKRAKLYHHITTAIIDNSFKMFKNKEESFSINIDIDDINNTETTTYIYNKIIEFDIGSRLIIEFLEYKEIKDFDIITDFINKVKQLGCKIAIDDFGSGYSNFSYVLKLQADFLKIDSSIIKNIDTDKNSLALAKSIVAFSNELGIKTIAEYVDRQEILNVIKEIGIDFGQGFYWGEATAII